LFRLTKLKILTRKKNLGRQTNGLFRFKAAAIAALPLEFVDPI
jgi:hypothetical protein